jgi:heterodisulfide reductase subunit C
MKVNEIQATRVESDFLNEVLSIPGGEGVRDCIQCGTCAASCPNADKMDYTPRKIIAMVRAGMKDEVLTSNSMWYCLSCYLCTVRCPRDIKPTDLMHALECLATRHGLSTTRTRTPLMYKAFVDSIKSSGRVHELGFMLKYYLRSNPLPALGMASTGMGMFLRGRMSLSGRKIKGLKEFKAILDKAHTLEGS